MGEMFRDVLKDDLAKAMEVAATGNPCRVGHYLIVDLDKCCGLKASYTTDPTTPNAPAGNVEAAGNSI